MRAGRRRAGGPDGASVPAAMSAENPRGPLVLCWDGSEGAERAIGHAARLFGRERPGVVLFAYVPTEASRGVLAGLSGPDAPIMGPSDAAELVERGVASARSMGIATESVLIAAERKTSEIITTLAEERDAPLIVMGQRERSALGTLVLGSVAREVLSANHRPVLLVGPGAPGPYPRRS
jgi:nucleotide-binding universal stress UspA family protein